MVLKVPDYQVWLYIFPWRFYEQSFRSWLIFLTVKVNFSDEFLPPKVLANFFLLLNQPPIYDQSDSRWPKFGQIFLRPKLTWCLKLTLEGITLLWQWGKLERIPLWLIYLNICRKSEVHQLCRSSRLEISFKCYYALRWSNIRFGITECN